MRRCFGSAARRWRPLRLLTVLFANHDTLIKAMAEAAFHSNPAVRFNLWLDAAYGRPPYGIFTDKRTSP